MRRNARSWGIKVALGIIALVFIFFMGGGGQIGGGPSAVATVAGEPIELSAFERARQRNEALYREQYGNRLTPDLLRALDIPSMTMNQLVESAVLRHEAERLGLSVPDDAVRAQIRSMEAFQRDGGFSPSVYRAIIQRSGTSAAAFEASLRRDMLADQLVDVIRRGVHVTEEEAFERYARGTEEMVLSYVVVEGKSLQDEVSLDDDELARYFAEHQEEYRQPEAVRIRYLAYSPKHFAARASVSDEEIEEYYILNEDEFTAEPTVSARHVLKRVAADAGDDAREEARKAILQVKERLAAGEDFATVAKEESEDPGSAPQGGDLGSFGRGKMVGPFEEAAFALAAGETSDVVESPFGFHIIHVYATDDGGLQPLAEVRERIAEQLASDTAGEQAFDFAAGDAFEVRAGRRTLEAVATERGLGVEETSWLEPGASIPGIGPAAELVDTAFALDEVGKTSDPVGVGGTYHLLQLVERRSSSIPELEEVRDRVARDFRKAKAVELARAQAAGLVAELESGRPLGEVAAEAGLEVKETEPFTRGGEFVAGFGNVRGLKEVAFATKADGEPLPRPFAHRGDVHVFVRKSLTTADREKFAEERDEVIAALRMEKLEMATAEFIRELKESTEISYNQVLLNQVLN